MVLLAPRRSSCCAIPLLIFALDHPLGASAPRSRSWSSPSRVLDSTRVFRLARAVGMNLAVLEFVEAARLRGEGLWWIIRREILPNALPPLIAEFGLRFCFNFLFVARLSFLGLGIQPPYADWGGMVRDNAGGDQLRPARAALSRQARSRSDGRRQPRGRLAPVDRCPAVAARRPRCDGRMPSPRSMPVLRTREPGRDRSRAPCWSTMSTLELKRGEVLGLIGESGAGKSTIGLAAHGLCAGRLPHHRRHDQARRRRAARARRRCSAATSAASAIAYIAQSAAASFNPAHDAMDQVARRRSPTA